MEKVKKLSMLGISESATVGSLTVRGGMRRRFLDLGLVPGSPVKCVGESPLGGMRAYLVRGAKIAIRLSDAEGILIK